MPGGFTWADVEAGYQAAGQAFIATTGVVVGIGVVVLLGVGVFVWALAKTSALGAESDRASIRAEARERMYRREAAIDTDLDEIDWSDWPERKAS